MSVSLFPPQHQVHTFGDFLLSDQPADRVALVDAHRTITYDELRHMVAEFSNDLALVDRSLVELRGARTIEFVVAYLGLLVSGHVPLLTTDRSHEQLVAKWRPAAAINPANGIEVVHHDAPPVELHQDLALLLSTSGSTGSPKLVRLSHTNLMANTTSIVDYLGLSDTDRGITSLPLHYCYGLSVLHSHLAVGGGLACTETSLVDPCFRDLMLVAAVTNLAGVPHTFDLLERVVDRDAPWLQNLRFITQAGGKLAADKVLYWHELLAAREVDLVVMYGQTEATARMAYLPPHLAATYPTTIGRPIPGGEFALRPLTEQQPKTSDLEALEDTDNNIGELVFRGPNVMMGYATEPEHLAAPAELSELRTGDVARYNPAGEVYEIVGRTSRFIKPFGLRIDLDRVEQQLSTPDNKVFAGGNDQCLVLVAPGGDAAELTRNAGELTALTSTSITVLTAIDVPRTESYKVDYGAFMALAATTNTSTDTSVSPGPTASPTASGSPTNRRVAAVFETTLGVRAVTDDDTFVALGGDSLSYIEVSIQLENVIGAVPDGWHLLPVRELAASERDLPDRRWFRPTEPTVPLRALGICLVVATHMGLFHFPGGAHMLLGIVGYNASRFLFAAESTPGRWRAVGRMVGRLAIPTMLWAALGAITFSQYGAPTLLLVNNYFGPETHDGGSWHFWFIEAVVMIVLAMTAILSLPRVARIDRRWPLVVPLMLLGGTILLRLWETNGIWYNQRYRPHAVAFFFVLGWLAHRTLNAKRRWPQRLLVSGLIVACTLGFFRNPTREWFIIVCLLVVLWVPVVPIPSLLLRPIALLASTSMWIYISHFAIWPPLIAVLPLPLAYVATIAAGITIGLLTDRLISRLMKISATNQSRPGLARLVPSRSALSHHN